MEISRGINTVKDEAKDIIWEALARAAQSQHLTEAHVRLGFEQGMEELTLDSHRAVLHGACSLTGEQRTAIVDYCYEKIVSDLCLGVDVQHIADCVCVLFYRVTADLVRVKQGKDPLCRPQDPDEPDSAAGYVAAMRQQQRILRPISEAVPA